MASFLEGIELRPVKLDSHASLSPVGLALGQGGSPLEVLVASSPRAPNSTTLRSAWKSRNAGRAAPLLLVVLHGERVSLCGPAGEDPPAYLGLDRGQVEWICREALDQSRSACGPSFATRYAPYTLEADSGRASERGLSRHSRTCVLALRQRTDWGEAGRQRPSGALGKSKAMSSCVPSDYGIERHDGATSILRAGERKVAVAVLLARDESPDLSGERFSRLSPISYALAVADREGLPWVVAQHGNKVRVHPVSPGVGVGQRGQNRDLR